MRVICKNNTVEAIPARLQKYAYTQDENGALDLTVGKEYVVYGLRKMGSHSFYLVNTDAIHAKYPWWMPDTLYEVSDHRIPDDWQKKTSGILKRDTVIAPSIYFGNENLIEDGEAPDEVMEIIYKAAED